MSESALISIEELLELKDDPSLKVFDIRGEWGNPPTSNEKKYLEGHIPGASYLDWIEHFLENKETIALSPVANLEKSKKSFIELGINEDDKVILYDDYAHMFACRVRWAMTYWGHKNVKILNGGWEHWKKNDLPIETESSRFEKGSFEPQDQKDLIISSDEIKDCINCKYIVDARGEAGFEKGHIKSAINIPFRSLLDQETGLFKDKDTLAKIFDQKIPEWRTKPIVSSCGSGYAGAVAAFALEILGVKAPLYDDSYSVYCNFDFKGK